MIVPPVEAPPPAVVLVLALAGLCAGAAFAVSEWVDHRLRRQMSDDEWNEHQRYRNYLRSTWFGKDKQAWRGEGSPEREAR